MASEKNERIVNLVIALLATKKFLTKEQIFRAVSGYEGNADANDRMFERDKEELRNLGIQIEVKSIDPLFDDELGYRISPDRFKFDLGPLTPEEITFLALAAEAWKESAIADIAHSTAIRLESLGIAADFSEISLNRAISITPDNLPELLEYANGDRLIEFKYLNQDDVSEAKSVQPHGIYSQNQRWYLYAVDTLNDQFRSYRLDRIDSEIKRSNKTFIRKNFEFPTTFFPEIEAIIEIRRDYATDLLNKAEIIEESGEWIRCKISFQSDNDALASILRNSPNIRVLEPVKLVSAVTSALHRLASLHG